MLSDRLRLILPAIIGLAVALVGEAKADFIENHAYSRATTHVENGPPNSDDIRVGGLDARSTATTTGGGVYYPDSTVIANSNARSYLVTNGPGVTFSLEAETNLAVAGRDGQGSAMAEASWEDILFLSVSDPRVVGGTLRLNLQLTGEFRREGVLNDGGGSSLGMSARGSNYDGSSLVISSAGASLDPFTFRTNGFDRFSGDATNFSATFHLDIPISPGRGYLGMQGAVYYKVALVANSSGTFRDGPDGLSGHIFASDPLTFESITLPDVGNVTPESLGVGIRFDSGIASPNVQAVPEPGSLALLGTGSAALLVYARRRRATAKAA